MDDILDSQLHNSNDRSFDTKTTKKINFIKIDANECIDSIKAGRNAIWAILALTLLSTFIAFYNPVFDVTSTDILVELIVAVIILGACIYYIPKNAKVGLGIALGFYVLIKILEGYYDPSFIIKGFLYKFLILYFLIKGLNAAFKLDKLNVKLSNLGISRDEILESISLIKYDKTEYTDLDNKQEIDT